MSLIGEDSDGKVGTVKQVALRPAYTHHSLLIGSPTYSASLAEVQQTRSFMV